MAMVFFCFLFFFPFVVERQSWLHQLVNHLVGRGWERKDIDGSRKKTNKTNNNSCVQRFENEEAKRSTLADVGSLCFLFSSSKLLWFMTYYAHLFLFDIFQSFLLRLLSSATKRDIPMTQSSSFEFRLLLLFSFFKKHFDRSKSMSWFVWGTFIFTIILSFISKRESPALQAQRWAKSKRISYFETHFFKTVWIEKEKSLIETRSNTYSQSPCLCLL